MWNKKLLLLGVFISHKQLNINNVANILQEYIHFVQIFELANFDLYCLRFHEGRHWWPPPDRALEERNTIQPTLS